MGVVVYTGFIRPQQRQGYCDPQTRSGHNIRDLERSMQKDLSEVFMMLCAHICMIIFALVSRALSDSVVWLKMTDAAVNTASTETVMRQPDKVFDLSDLVMKTEQFEIYSVAVHSPGFITSQIEVSRAVNGIFNGTWTSTSLIVDVTGQASFLGQTFRIDSRVVIKDLSLGLTFRQDDNSLVKLAGCGFTFQIESIRMRDSSLQSFVSIWRRQFLNLPPRAICYRMGILHRAQPLYLFGLPEDQSKKMAPTAVALKDFAMWIAFQRRGTEAGMSAAGSPPDIDLDSPTSLTVFFPRGFISELINPKMDAILQSQFTDRISARTKLSALADYFDMGETTLEDKEGYTGLFSLDLQDHDLIINKESVMSTILSTLHFNISSQCGDYSLFTLNWKLDISVRMIFNDQSLFLRVGDLRSEVFVKKSLIGNPKRKPKSSSSSDIVNFDRDDNLSKLMEDLDINDFIEGQIVEDLAFFLGNTAVLSNTVLTGKQNYLVLQSGTTLRPKVTPWKEFGTLFTGDRVRVINNENLNAETVNFCENTPRTVKGSSAINSYKGLLVLFLAVMSTITF